MQRSAVATVGAFMREISQLTGVHLLWRYPPHGKVLPRTQFHHCNPYCFGVKNVRRRAKLCQVQESTELTRRTAKHGGTFKKLCHAGVLEWVAPILDGKVCRGVLIAGPFRPAQGQCPYRELETQFRQLPVPGRELVHRMHRMLDFLNAHIHLLFQQEAEHLAGTDPADARIQKAMRLVQEQSGKPCHIPEVAQACALSSSRLVHLFRRETGVSFVRHRTQTRVAQAKQRLLTTDQALAAIASDLGFADQSHFGAVFKKWTGLSPRQFRLRGRQANDS